MTPRAVLIGPPGAGKSTIGRKLANALGVPLTDTDADIESTTGRTIADIFSTEGEPEFRRIEEEIVARALDEAQGVVSLGGGAILSERTRERLAGHVVVYLDISVREGLRRTGRNSTRPLLNGGDPAERYRSLLLERRPLYRGAATIRIRTDGRSPGRVVTQLIAELGEERVDPDARHPEPTRPDRTPPSATRPTETSAPQ